MKPPLNRPPITPQCNGMCLTGSDIGIPSSQVAYAHPHCPEHGDGCPGFSLHYADTIGRMVCGYCQCYQSEHEEQMTPSLYELEWRREMIYGYPENAAAIPSPTFDIYREESEL